MGTPITTLLNRVLNLLKSVFLIALVVGTFWFALGGFKSMAVGLIASLAYGAVLGLLQGLREGFRRGLTIGLVGGLAVGLVGGFLGIIFPDRLAARVLFGPGDFPAVVLALNLAIALVRIDRDQPRMFHWADSLPIGATNGALVSGISIAHALIGGGNVTPWSLFTGTVGVLGGVAVGVVAAPVAEYLAFWLTPRLRVFVALLPYLREIWVPLGGFAVAYLSLIFLFAIFIGVTWRADPAEAYRGLSPDPRFGSFFYLSVETITGIGYANITPHSASAKALASVEVILGIMWNTVFVATFIAYLQPRFQRLRKEPDKTPSRASGLTSSGTEA